ncbi:MAG: S8 family serine peptidase [Fibrobacter sp.]|nr:S8 family serine peptidase [Fibrobacter sp.]
MTCTKFFKVAICSLIFTVNAAWATQAVRLLCERNRTDPSWIDYRISLKNTSSHSIFNPKIHYYAADTSLLVDVDYVTYPYSVTRSVTNVGGMADIKFSVHGLLYPQKKIEINFRIHREKWTPVDFSKDWSYAKRANVSEPNYFMTVYDDSHNILWGYDPVNGNSSTGDVIAWTDRGKSTAVSKFSGGNETLPAGRFWLFKDTPLSPKERDLLAQRGVSKLSVGKSDGKVVAVLKTENRLKKKTLDSLVAGFFNAIPVADTVPLSVELTDKDLYTERNVCDSNGVCSSLVEPRTKIDMEIICWEDVDVNDCVTAVHDCGGEDIGVARGFLVASTPKDSLQCLGRSRSVEALDVQREMPTLTPTGRSGVNISDLQDDSNWISALNADSATMDWLKGLDYTGEGIVVGVYEDSVDFDHPTFIEYDSDSLRKPHVRIMDSSEYYGLYYETAKAVMDSNIKLKNVGAIGIAQYHGTAVTGIVGGNGNNSSHFKYRGVAPKVHFYTNPSRHTNQIGHVVNHSHVSNAQTFYHIDESLIDNAIFNNWKSECTPFNSNNPPSLSNCIEGDTLVKTVIYGAGNSGFISPDTVEFYHHQSYHSIFAPAKNPIVVGMINAVTKTRIHSSSMGPTWDGRIKPDIMAPGGSSQFRVDETSPFEVEIDYIKLYRQGESTPYIVNDFETNRLNLDLSWTYPPTNPCKEENHRLHCLVNHHPISIYNDSTSPILTIPPATELYIAWRLTGRTDIDTTDEVEVRYRIVKDNSNRDTTLYGEVYFGTCPSDPKKACSIQEEDHIFIPWRVTDKFESIRVNLSSLHHNIKADELRIDFAFTKGITTPDICHEDSCGYWLTPAAGTSMAAPFTSGVAALMYQKFQKLTGDPLDKHSMRNSTVKALMIHTAVDMEDSEDVHFACNTDLTVSHNDGECHFTPYGKGPDFATGWGYLDGKAALNMISGYNPTTKEFPKFKELEIGNGYEKRWTVKVDSIRNYLRTTLVWDDAPGVRKKDLWTYEFKDPRLVNDLDMYLISPSGKYHYPWRLDTLPTEFINEAGRHIDVRIQKSRGLEKILESDVYDAYNSCPSNVKLDYECFDHLNNVEVVDVENPEPGTWQVVVFGRSVNEPNNDSANAQVATLVSDLKLSRNEKCEVTRNYKPQTDYRCTYDLGKDIVYYVTFHDSTFVGNGDDIVLTDANGNTIGTYNGNELAGKVVKVKSKKLTVTLHSDNDDSQGWGFAVTRIRSISESILKMPFEAIRKKRRTP